MKHVKQTRPGKEHGAALATVLVMVAVMSGLAISVVDVARFSIQRTANQTQMDQTRWYLLGAEAYATSRINQLLNRADTTTADVSQWLGRSLSLPLDDGAMQITVWDGGNCFNLNSVARQDESGPLIANEDGQLRFTRLLSLLGVPSGRQLAGSLSDWIDADAILALGGAEDHAYGGDSAVFLPPNRLMGDPSELRSVNGFDTATIARLGSLTCVRPTASPNVLDVNSLRRDQAPLLAAAFGGGLSLASAERIIAERPLNGWASVDDFFRDPRLAGVGISAETKALFAILPRWYVIAARVQYQGAAETSVALIDAASGHARVVRRVFGAAAIGTLL